MIISIYNIYICHTTPPKRIGKMPRMTRKLCRMVSQRLDRAPFQRRAGPRWPSRLVMTSPPGHRNWHTTQMKWPTSLIYIYNYIYSIYLLEKWSSRIENVCFCFSHKSSVKPWPKMTKVSSLEGQNLAIVPTVQGRSWINPSTSPGCRCTVEAPPEMLKTSWFFYVDMAVCQNPGTPGEHQNRSK